MTKAGRKKIQATSRRKHQVTFWADDMEYAQIEAAMLAAGERKMADYVRRAVAAAMSKEK